MDDFVLDCIYAVGCTIFVGMLYWVFGPGASGYFILLTMLLKG